MIERLGEVLLDTVGVGLAIVHPDSRAVVLHNTRLAAWFPDVVAGATLDGLLPGLDALGLAAAAEEGRPWRQEIEVKVKRRALVLAVEISRYRGPELDVLIVEAQNVSKIKELEYMIESYSAMVERQNRTLRREKERVEKLLLNIMPKSIYEELKTFGVTTPQRFEAASVLMLDFVGFTEMTVTQDPAALIAELNDIFTSFDRIAEQFGCERIKTIGDAYVAVAGLPEPSPDHAASIARTALLFRRYLERRNLAHTHIWRCRIGIACGPVIGSIVGVQKYVYDIFGAGVNLAARMEAVSGPMEITLPDELYRLIRAEFRCRELGEHEVKGFGRRRLWSLEASLDPEPLEP